MNELQRKLFWVGVLFLGLGFLIMVYDRIPENPDYSEDPEMHVRAAAEIREGEEYLRRNSRSSAEEAATIFNRVLSWNISQNTNQSARFGLAMALERLDDHQAAFEHLRELRRQPIEDTELSERVDFSLGRMLLLTRRSQEGRSILDNLLAKTDNRKLKSQIHTAFGDYHQLKDEKEQAEENYRLAIEYYPDNLHAELARASVLRGERYSRPYYEYYDEDLISRRAEFEERQEPEVRERVIVRERPGREDERERSARQHQEKFDEAIRAYRADEFGKAREGFENLLQEEPSEELHEKTLFWLAETYAGSGDQSRALETYDLVLKTARSDFNQAAHIKKGILLFHSNSFELAAREFLRAIEDYPGGEFTARAEEWMNETKAQIEERRQLRAR